METDSLDMLRLHLGPWLQRSMKSDTMPAVDRDNGGVVQQVRSNQYK